MLFFIYFQLIYNKLKILGKEILISINKFDWLHRIELGTFHFREEVSDP